MCQFAAKNRMAANLPSPHDQKEPAKQNGRLTYILWHSSAWGSLYNDNQHASQYDYWILTTIKHYSKTELLLFIVDFIYMYISLMCKFS